MFVLQIVAIQGLLNNKNINITSAASIINCASDQTMITININ